MKINITNKDQFINKFLVPLNKLNENLILKLAKNKITSITATNDGVLILHCIYSIDSEVEEDCNLNIPNVSKLIKVLSCIAEDNIELVYDRNCLQYTSPTIKFKYHLLEEGILTSPAISLDKIKKLDFNTHAEIKYDNISNLIKGSTFTTDTNKIYFYTKDNSLYGELTDKQKHNIDSYTQHITDSYTGEDIVKHLPLDFEVVRLISTIRFDIVNMHIAQDNNVFMFDIDSQNSKLNYIASGFTK